MKTFAVKNFRIFDKETKIEFSPVTILTGANSSGKSSYVKAMVLFSRWMEQISNEYHRIGKVNLLRHPLNFSDTDLKFKGFSSVLNRKCNANDLIYFSYDIDLPVIGQYSVEYGFLACPNDNDKGILQSIKMYHNGDIFYSGNGNADFINERNTTLDFNESISNFDVLEYFPCDQFKNTLLLEDFFKFHNEITLPLSKIRFTGEHKNSLPFSYDEIDKPLLRTDLTNEINNYKQNGIIFNFSLLEKFNDLSKEEAIDLLQSIRPINPEAADLLIDSFKESNMVSFLEFYKNLEKEFLENEEILTNSSDYFLEETITGGTSIAMVLNLDEIRLDGAKNPVHEGFECAYKLLYDWQKRDCGANTASKLFDHYLMFISYLFRGLLLLDDITNAEYFNGSFEKVKRLYSFEDNSPIVKHIQEIVKLNNKLGSIINHYNELGEEVGDTNAILSSGLNDYKVGTFRDKWLKELEIGDELIIEKDNEGLGFKLYIRNGEYKESLADLGHGISQIVMLLLLLEKNILKTKIEQYISLDEEFGDCFYHDTYVIVEEPEVSLHPCFQSKLAQMFKEATEYGRKLHIIIETHSEYIVRKTQAIVANFSASEFEKNPFAVYYFDRDGFCYPLKHKNSGRFDRAFGEGFFDESARLNYQVLKKENELEKQ